MALVKKAYLPVFSPNRFESDSSVTIKPDAVWAVSEDTTYQYDTMSSAVPIKSGVVRGVPAGVSSITFGNTVTVEIQE